MPTGRIGEVKNGAYWVRFEILKNAKSFVSAVLVSFCIKFNLGLFLQKHLIAVTSKVGWMDGKVVAGGAAADLGLAPDWLKNLAFDFSWSENVGGGRRGTGAQR